MSVRYQIAQKIHACTEVPEDDRPNDRFRDLIDIQLLHELIPPDGLASLTVWAEYRARRNRRLEQRPIRALCTQGVTGSSPVPPIPMVMGNTDAGESLTTPRIRSISCTSAFGRPRSRTRRRSGRLGWTTRISRRGSSRRRIWRRGGSSILITATVFASCMARTGTCWLPRLRATSISTGG